jgi:hypothetical protein
LAWCDSWQSKSVVIQSAEFALGCIYRGETNSRQPEARMEVKSIKETHTELAWT